MEKMKKLALRFLIVLLAGTLSLACGGDDDDDSTCTPTCDGKVCGDDGCEGTCGECAADQTCTDGQCTGECTPACDGKVCGDDGCQGSCGECAEGTCTDGQCVVECTPDCEGKECGDDGCGDVCGECPTAAPICNEGFKCVADCSPACEGMECGDDGCGGTCGECPGAAPICNEGICEPDCTPDCEGKECGDDGCGDVCGECPDATPICNEDGICEPDCEPDCTDLECGDDGCGGSCGECDEEGDVCLEGLCVFGDTCEDMCGDSSLSGDCFCDDLCTATGDCCDDVCEFCPDTEGCCEPQCDGLECGDDGCGGECGVCDANAECNVDGLCQCTEEATVCGELCCDGSDICFEDVCCTPDCEGKDCGDDGCGGSCGECGAEWEECAEGACEELCPDLSGEWPANYLESYTDCLGEDYDPSHYGMYLSITKEEGLYVVKQLDLAEGQPSELDEVFCSFSVEECELTCSCDAQCTENYFTAMKEYNDNASLIVGGEAEYTFFMENDYVSYVMAGVWTDADADTCIVDVDMIQGGEGIGCAACDQTKELEGTSDCDLGYACIDYTYYPGNAFCTPMCLADEDCDEGFVCTDTFFCSNDSEATENVCLDGDVYMEDSCGQSIGPMQDCGNATCESGACVCDMDGVDALLDIAMYNADEDYIWYEGQTAAEYPLDSLRILVFGVTGLPFETGYYALDDTNLSECNPCLLAYKNWTDDGFEKVFLLTDGFIAVDAIGVIDDQFTGGVYDATFAEVTIDTDTMVSTPVDNGETWCIDEYTFDITIVQYM